MEWVARHHLFGMKLGAGSFGILIGGNCRRCVRRTDGF